jgi:Flp pilus assembly pilin Flp
MRKLKRFIRDEKGVTMIMVAFALVMIFAFAVLAIDLSMIQLAKTQLQNAADAAALAAAWVLCTTGDEDSARAEAIRVAGLNIAVEDTVQRSVIIGDGDVTIDSNLITVVTHRTKATGHPVSLYFMKVLGGENKGEMSARAKAGCGSRCLKPFCPPDRWYDANGDGLWNPDSGDYYDPITTGYMAPTDIGDTIVLYLNNKSSDFKQGWFYPVRFPGYQGADDYREWIGLCCKNSSTMIHIGDQLLIEDGVMRGPTKQGLSDLIAMDPAAHWDAATGTVVGSCCGVSCSECCEGGSPRVIKVPAFDPVSGLGPGHGYVTIVKILVIFVEGFDNQGNITGRFIDVGGNGGFIYSSALVE